MDPVAVADLDAERTRVLDEIADRRDLLVEQMVSSIVREIPVYAKHPDAALRADLTAHVGANIDAFLRAASEDRAPRADELTFIGDSVAQRIAQGVPMDQVLHAFRIGQRVLWETVVAEARAVGASSEATLSLARPAMQYTDCASSEFTERYVRVEQELHASSAQANAEIVAALSEGRWPAERTLTGLRRSIPIAEHQAYLAAVTAGLSIDRLDEACRHSVLIASTGSFDGAVADGAGGQLVTIAAVRRGMESHAPGDLAAGLVGIAKPLGQAARVGVGGVADGVVQIPHSLREATMAVRQAQPGRPLVLPELNVVERVAVLAARGVAAQRLVPDRHRQFISDDLEADGTLTQTLIAYAACDLNTKQTADKLFVHRNTVRYRLSRIGELSGIDTRSPRQVFELDAAIRILRVGRAGAGNVGAG